MREGGMSEPRRRKLGKLPFCIELRPQINDLAKFDLLF